MLRVLVLGLLLFPGAVVAGQWRLDPATTVTVDVRWQGSTVPVRFPEISGEVEFDEAAPETARAQVAIESRAATTGVAVVDALVRSDGYLATGAHPRITFQLDALRRTSRSTADIIGRITLRGVTRPVTFKATVFRYGPAEDDPKRFEAGFDLTGAIDRTEFGSTGGLPEVAAVLPVRIRLLMTSR